MHSFNRIGRAAGVSALLAIGGLTTVAHAGEADRARIAIAAAQSKIDASDRVGSGGEAGAMQARAHEALRSAQMNLSRGKKQEAISDAQHASELADLAISAADHNKNAVVRNERDARANAEASAAAARDSAAAANDRAQSAEQQAAAASAQADALRNAPPPPPAPVATTTTVATTETTDKVIHTPAHRTRHVVVHNVPATTSQAKQVDKTTTTVTTAQQPQ